MTTTPPSSRAERAADRRAGRPQQPDTPAVRRTPTGARAAARADQRLITARYVGGEPVSRIADAYGVSSTWLRTQLETWGVSPRPLHAVYGRRRSSRQVFRGRQPSRTREEVAAAREALLRDRDEVIRRYEAGESGIQLAREYRVSPSWFYKMFEEWGVTRRSVADLVVLRQHTSQGGS